MIKIGGSLAETPDILKLLCAALAKLSVKYQLLIVPGGGKFADVVREYDRRFALPAEVAHRLAIAAMDQYGAVLSQLIPNGCPTEKLEDIPVFLSKGQLPVFLPAKLLVQEETLDSSWDVTSDSIAAFIAKKVNAAKVVLVTDVDGIFTKNPKHHASARLMHEVSAQWLLSQPKRTSVDKFLPKFLLRHPLPCYIVNGHYPERIAAILSAQKSTYTLIKL
ncbi:MAG: delta 1-pyrroline-5-carboxylate synthetase [Candidatus Bathyarchaeia archaeon]